MSVALLNRLLAIHGRSLPVYLADAVPWIRDGQGDAAELLKTIASDHKRTTNRLGEYLVEAGDRWDPGGFPMEFTSYHDLSLDYLLSKLIDHQQQDIGAIEEVVDAAAEESNVRGVAEECLGAAKGHLESLRELSTSCSI